MDLRVTGVGEERPAPVRPPRRSDVAGHGVGGQVIDVAVPAGRQHHRMTCVRSDLAGDEVAGDDAAGPPVFGDQVQHLGSGVELDAAGGHLLRERLVGAQQELLAGLAPGIERAADLCAAEGPVVEQPAVLACERHALCGALVDDVQRHLGQAVHVGLTAAVVAALDRVIEEPVHRVAVIGVVLRRIDAALGCDRVRPARRVVEGEHLHPVAQL